MDPKNSFEASGEHQKLSSPHDSVAQVTPTDTTVTLPTPDLTYAQLAGVQCHNPPRFIFYPISWDGSEELPTQAKTTDVPSSDVYTEYLDDNQPHSPSAVLCSPDAFWSIDRWRRDVVKCGSGTADLLDPIQDADTPLPLLSLPHDHRRGPFGYTQPSRPSGTETHGSESDSVKLWIHP